MTQHNLDALVAPGNEAAWPIDHENGDNPYTYIPFFIPRGDFWLS
ncbi:MAG: hypothetical protein CM1200mP40_01330 [Gammaproteobacteria bacterium]|nr:MAG: hypothetical protein CM1200mP40_01330 [Gammaproteobacteria bacterium]